MFTQKSARPSRRTLPIALGLARSVAARPRRGRPCWGQLAGRRSAAADDRARARRLGRRIVLDSVIKRLQRKGFTVVAPPNLLRGPATDAPYLASYLEVDLGPDRARRPLLRRVRRDERRHRQRQRQGARLHRRVHARRRRDRRRARGTRGLLRRGAPSTSCRTTEAWICTCAGKRTRPPGFTSASPTASIARRPPSSPPCSGPRHLRSSAEPSGPPAWKTIPSWSLIGTQDHVIPLALQEEMSSRAGAHITRLKAGHLSLITHPGDVTKVILAAVDATSTSAG